VGGQDPAHACPPARSRRLALGSILGPGGFIELAGAETLERLDLPLARHFLKMRRISPAVSRTDSAVLFLF
jgi:hypothetical protein